MDPEKGAKFELKASEPTLMTSVSKPGLTYTLREGTTLGGMSDGESKLADGMIAEQVEQAEKEII